MIYKNRFPFYYTCCRYFRQTPLIMVALLEDQVADLRQRLDRSEIAQAELRRLLLAANSAITDLTSKLAALPAPSSARPEPAPQAPSAVSQDAPKPIPPWREVLNRMREQSGAS